MRCGPALRFSAFHLDRAVVDLREGHELDVVAPDAVETHARDVRVEVDRDETLEVRGVLLEVVARHAPHLGVEVFVAQDQERDGAVQAIAVAGHASDAQAEASELLRDALKHRLALQGRRRLAKRSIRPHSGKTRRRVRTTRAMSNLRAAPRGSALGFRDRRGTRARGARAHRRVEGWMKARGTGRQNVRPSARSKSWGFCERARRHDELETLGGENGGERRRGGAGARRGSAHGPNQGLSKCD